MSEEQQLVEQAKADPQAFGKLYDRYYSKIAGYIQHRVGEVPASQDITSTVFFKAMTSLPRFAWRGVPFSAWLYRIASNEINSYFRGAQRRPLSLDELYEDYQFEIPAATDLERELITRQEQAQKYRDFRLVRRLLRELPDKYQQVLALRYFEKKTLQEIALITGKNLGTVKSLLSRGLQRLRQAYAEAEMSSQTQPSLRPTVIKSEEEIA